MYRVSTVKTNLFLVSISLRSSVLLNILQSLGLSPFFNNKPRQEPSIFVRLFGKLSQPL